MQCLGDYYEANKSQKHEVLLYIEGNDQLVIKPLNNSAGSIIQRASLSDIEVSPRIGQTPRSIVFQDQSVFETLENDKIDVWLNHHKSHNSLGWIHRLESRLVYVLFTLVFVSVFSWGFIKYCVPGIADTVAQALPVEANQYLGKGTLDLLDENFFSPTQLTTEQQENLLRQFKSYTNNYPDLNINVLFRQGGSIGANAFALPDGHIVFTDEMVELAKDDRELIAILGHEIGHLEHRHLLRRMLQDSLLTSLVVLITGDISYASSVIIAVPAILLDLSFSRQFEIEADQFALEFMQSNEIKPHYFADIMLRLSKYDDKDPSSNNSKGKNFGSNYKRYLSTHPVTQERIKPFL